MVFLIYEQVTGKPVSPGVQGAATLAALALIGSMFLIVTYNDIANLLWR
jgi:membrane-associated protease RseP (regulator of RpoE activity)